MTASDCHEEPEVTLLMIFCYTCRQELSIIIIREILPSNSGNGCRDPQLDIRRSWVILGKSERKDCRSQRGQGHHKDIFRISEPGHRD